MIDFLTTCRNCGKQVFLDGEDGLEEKCYFCGKPALKKEANIMSAKEETKIATTTLDEKSALPPVPPRPENSRYGSRRYYDDNREAILKDRAALGEKAMCRRWGISQATWICKRKDGSLLGIAARWGISPAGKASKSAKPKKEKMTAIVKGPPPRPSGEVPYCPSKLCPNCELAIEYRGYRQAVRDMAGDRLK